MTELKPCSFKPLDGFHTYLEKGLCAKNRWIELEDELLEHLPEYDDWTTLAIYDGKVMEVVRVRNRCGYIMFDRAFEGTKRLRFPCGAYVEFIMTKIGIESMVCCSEWFENCNEV